MQARRRTSSVTPSSIRDSASGGPIRGARGWPAPEEVRLEIDPAQLDRADAYRLLVQLIVPRPIAWVGSRGPDGQDNLAPFSYFMGVSSEPPRLAISVARGRGGARKDTARNLLHARQFTVSMPEERDLDAMHATSAPYEESEFEAVGIARAEGARVAAPYVSGARIVLECEVEHQLDLGQVDLFVGRIVLVRLDDSLVRDGAFDPTAERRPIARLGGDHYAGLGPVFTRAPARVPSRS